MSIQSLSSLYSSLARITPFLEKRIDIFCTQKLLGHDGGKNKETDSQGATREMEKIKTPWMIFLRTKRSTKHADSGSVVEQKQKYNGNKHT